MAGRWSDWQDYGTRSFPYQRFAPDTLDTGLTVLQYAESPVGAASWPDMSVQLGDQLAAAQAGEDSFGAPTAPGQAGAVFSADKSNRTGFGIGHSWHASVQLAQTYITFGDPGHEEDLDMFPPLLASLVQGVDWDYNPDSGEAVEYEGLAVRTGWEDWATTVSVELPSGVGQEATLVDNDDTSYAEYNQTYHWFALADDPAGAWLAYGAGVEVAVHAAVSSVDQPTYEAPILLALSELGAVPAVHLAVQPGALGPEGQPVADFVVAPPAAAADNHGRVYNQLVSTWGIDTHRYAQPGPAVVYQQPRFRYWIPGPTEVPYLRMTQRDDGMGIRAHARLDVASDTANQATSVQHARTPRVGQSNTYV